MLSSFDHNLGFDPLNYVATYLANGFTLCCGFVLFILTVVNFDFNFYYPRINEDIYVYSYM